MRSVTQKVALRLSLSTLLCFVNKDNVFDCLRSIKLNFLVQTDAKVEFYHFLHKVKKSKQM